MRTGMARVKCLCEFPDASGLADIVGRNFCFWRITSISTIRPKLFRGAEALFVASAGYGTMGKTVGRVG
jgi:hypothetical protein